MLGRAAGGMADTIRRRIVEQDEFIDGAIETAPDRFRRVQLRMQARALWRGAAQDREGFATALGVTEDLVQRALAAPYFGAAWAALERECRSLFSRRVRFAELPAEIAVAEELCAFARAQAEAAAEACEMASA
jgi:hypothetical protein